MRIVGAEAARCSAALDVQVRDRAAIAVASDEVDELLARRGEEFARPLQRAVRDLMTECCGVVRNEDGLEEGLARLDEVVERAASMEVRPDLAGYADLAHAFDLEGSLLAARATLESALERRESRGAHARLDYPEQDPRLRVNLVWDRDGGITAERPGEPSARVAALAGGPEIETIGRLLEGTNERGRSDERAAAVAGARPAVARGLGAGGRRGRLGSSDLVDVGRRSDGGAAGEVPALRLRPAGGAAERPPDLLEGPRLAVAVLAVQGGGRDLG
jgi:hypothetical protein